MRRSRTRRVMVPVSDQTKRSGSTHDAGVFGGRRRPLRDNDRWVEVAPPSGGAALALVPPQGEYQPGRMTGIALESSDPAADHAELQGKGVDVDAALLGGDGGAPLLFFFRDNNKNQLMIVQGQ